MRPRAIGVAVIVLLFAGLAYLEFSREAKPIPPSLPDVSSCGGLRPGMRRIGEMGFQDVGFRFDVPMEDFTIHEGCTDAGPPICGFDIRPKNSTAWSSISWGEETTERKPPDPILDSSDNVETRRTRTIRGDRSVRSPGGTGEKVSAGGASISWDGFRPDMARRTKGTFPATDLFTRETPHCLIRS